MSVMQVPRLIAPGLTLGAALSNSSHDRPPSSLPVTTRRIGFSPSAIGSPQFSARRKASSVRTALSSHPVIDHDDGRDQGAKDPGRMEEIVRAGGFIASIIAVA